jgi:hypothetical protein
MVNVEVPVGVLLVVETLRVELPWPVTDVGLNVQVVFEGQPLRLNVTTPLNPFEAVTVAVYVVLRPRLTDRLEGVAAIVKLPVAFTTSVTDVLWTRMPLVPLIVRVYVPVGVVLVVVTFRVELVLPLAGGVTDVGLSPQVAFEGQPLTVRETDELNPFEDVTVAV